jgi:hypothetical protein
MMAPLSLAKNAITWSQVPLLQVVAPVFMIESLPQKSANPNEWPSSCMSRRTWFWIELVTHLALLICTVLK